MKRNFLRSLISVHVGVGLVLTGIGIAIAAPCYQGQWQMPPARCNPIGAGCGGVGAAPALGCPGAYVVNQPGVNIGWPCGWNVISHAVPVDYVTTGNLPAGSMDQGLGGFACRSNRTCNKAILPMVPVVVNCAAVAVFCEQTTRWTAIGPTCPGGGGSN